jgi:hypothetical protein
VGDVDTLTTDVGLATATTVSDAAGRFTFLGVPPGSYVLRSLTVSPAAGNGATSPGSTPSTLWATQSVSVDSSDVNDVVVALREGFQIVGGVEFDDAAHGPPPDDVARIVITFESADGRALPLPQLLRSQCDAGGRFRSAQLPPGRYVVRITGAPPGWMLKEATVDGRDISTVPLQLKGDVSAVVITLTHQPSELNGQVHSTSGRVDATATALIFPVQSAGWIDTGATPNRLRAIRTGRDGAFRVVGLPAGDYLVVAVADESTTDWQDPRTLQALAKVAIQVTLRDGEARTLVLKTVLR